MHSFIFVQIVWEIHNNKIIKQKYSSKCRNIIHCHGHCFCCFIFFASSFLIKETLFLLWHKLTSHKSDCLREFVRAFIESQTSHSITWTSSLLKSFVCTTSAAPSGEQQSMKANNVHSLSNLSIDTLMQQSSNEVLKPVKQKTATKMELHYEILWKFLIF